MNEEKNTEKPNHTCWHVPETSPCDGCQYEQAVSKENLHAEIEMLRNALNELQELINSLCDERDRLKEENAALKSKLSGNPEELAVSKENLPTEQASNYGEVAGVKINQDIIKEAIKECYPKTSEIRCDILYRVKFADSKATFKALDIKQQDTLNAVRGIIEAMQQTAKVNSWNGIKVAHEILTEINKLQP